jgi:CDP-diacylglycerol--serine O-phosphatidyltransferase
VLEGKRQQTEGGCNKFYRGLPVTTISMLLPLGYFLGLLLPEGIFAIVLHVLMAVCAFLFVLDFRVKKIQVTVLFKR